MTGLAALGVTPGDFGRPALGGDAVAAGLDVYRAAGAWPR
jgi:hypothetical protein